MHKNIQVEKRGNVVVISIDDPATLNALSLPLVSALDVALAIAQRESRAIVLTGTGRAFCSGANLNLGLDPNESNYDAGSLLDSHFNPLMQRIRSLRIPIVTAVNGAAAGIGASIALAGDLIVAAKSAYFLQAFQRIGLVPDGGSAFLLTHATGKARAMEMMLLAEPISAPKALEWGLINRVVPDVELIDAALTLASQLASGPTLALGMIRRLGWEAMQTDFTNLLNLERELQREAGGTSDHREGIEAFREKRPARFSGL
jgi:2-(1,2-epoxy-1,2-dihydrophenyl)acetyl-CoA isomerase